MSLSINLTPNPSNFTEEKEHFFNTVLNAVAIATLFLRNLFVLYVYKC